MSKIQVGKMRLRHLILGIFFVMLAFILHVILSDDADATILNDPGPPAHGDWTIVSPFVMCVGEDLHVDGNITISAGCSLTVSDSNITIVENATKKHNIQLESGATIIMDRTTVKGMSANATYGFVAGAGAIVNIFNSTFSELGYVPATTNALSKPTNGSGMLLKTDFAQVRNNRFFDCYSCVILAGEPGSPVKYANVTGNVFEHISNYSVMLYYANENIIECNRISNCTNLHDGKECPSGRVILVHSNSNVISSNTFENISNDSIALTGSSTGNKVSHNDFIGIPGNAVLINGSWDATACVEFNTFEDCTVCICISGGTSNSKFVDIEGNTFNNSDIGILSHSTMNVHAVVGNNTFQNMIFGIRTWCDTSTLLVNNDITDCDCFFARANGTLSAEWLVEGHSYIRSSKLLIPGNITILHEFYIEDSVITFDSYSASTQRCMSATGIVTMKGATLNCTAPFTFTAQFVNFSTVSFDHTNFSRCGRASAAPYEQGLYVAQSDFAIDGCSFSDCYNGLVLNGSQGRIANSTFNSVINTGVVSNGNIGLVVISRNYFTSCANALGEPVKPLSRCVIELNSIGSVINGICINEANTLSGNVVTSSLNALCVYGSNNTILHSNFVATNNATSIYASSNSFERCDLQGYRGIMCDNAGENIFTNCSIKEASTVDIELGNSVVRLFGTSFDNSTTHFKDAQSQIYVYWFLRVKVVNNNDSIPLPNATVTVSNNYPATVFSGLTGIDGCTPFLACLEYVGADANGDGDDLDAGERLASNPYSIFGSYDAYSNAMSVVMGSSKNITMGLALAQVKSFVSTSPADEGADGWFDGPVAVTLHSNYANATIYYEIPGFCALSVYNGTIFLNSTGKYTVMFYARLPPFAREQPTNLRRVWIDCEAPTTSNNTLQAWYSTDYVRVTFTAVDAGNGSGVATTYYSVDDQISNWTTGTYFEASVYDIPIGPHTIYFYSVDVAGNVEDIRSCGFSVDTSTPVTSCDYNGEWHSAAFIVNFTASDTGSGVQRTEYRLDGGAWQAGTSVNVTSALTGIHQLEYRSVDKVGNVEVAKSIQLKFDGLPPITTVEYQGANRTRTNIQLFISARDNDYGSGLNTTWYRVDDGMPVLCTENKVTIDISVIPDGMHAIGYYSIDHVGNVEPEQLFYITIDTKAPVISINSPINGSELTTNVVRLEGSVSDEDETVLVQARIGEGVWMDCTGGKSWAINMTLAKGESSLVVRALDTAGNIEQTSIVVVVKEPVKDVCPLPRNMLILIAIALVAVIAIAAITRRRKKADAREVEDTEHPGMHAQPSQTSPQSAQTQQSARATPQSQGVSPQVSTPQGMQIPAQPAAYASEYTMSQQSYMPEKYGYSYYEQSASGQTQDIPATSGSSDIAAMEASPVTGAIYGDEYEIPMASEPESEHREPTIIAGDEFAIEGVFLIYQDGRPIAAYSGASAGEVDKELISSMLTALRQYMKIAMKDKTHDLRQISFGKNTVLMEKGIQMYIACIISGTPPQELSREMRKVLISIRDKYTWIVKYPWDGDTSKFAGVDGLITSGLIEKFKPRGTSKFAFINGEQLSNFTDQQGIASEIVHSASEAPTAKPFEAPEDAFVHPAAFAQQSSKPAEEPSQSILIQAHQGTRRASKPAEEPPQSEESPPVELPKSDSRPAGKVTTIDGQRMEIYGDKSKVHITYDEAKARVEKIKARIDALKMRGVDTQDIDKKFNLSRTYLVSKNFAKCYKFAEEAENGLAKLGG